MINLFSQYDSDAWDLHYSLELDGVHNKTLALDFSGFLPKDVSSPWESYIYTRELPIRPLHANHLKLPSGVELESDDGVFYLYGVSGILGRVFFYGDVVSRLVRSVDYFDSKGQILVTENYCNRGFVFRRDYYISGSWVSSVYFNNEGEEVISHDLSTGIVRDGSKVYNGLSEFYLDYISSLNEPVLFTEDLLGMEIVEHLDYNPNNTLVVMDRYGLELPKNIDEASNSFKLVFTNHAQYDEVKGKYPNSRFASLKFKVSSELGSPSDVVITTDTDNLVGIERLVSECRNTTFHILASTLVSRKLEALGELDNVVVYPAASQEEVDSCFAKAGIFLDISTGSTIFDANKKAVENSMLRIGLLGVSSGKYITKELMLPKDVEGVVNILNLVSGSGEKLRELYLNQKTLLGYNSPASFELAIK